MAEHSVLSPSSSNRWFNCTRSARLCLQFPDEGSVYASEGTEAHRLCQFLLNIALGRPDEDPRPGMKFWTQEMQEYCEAYVAFILDCVAHYQAAGAKPTVLIEQRVDLRRFVPESQGTADCLIIAGNEATVVDFKYGMLRVSASSLQLRLYALGACEMFSVLYHFDAIRTVIFQPRLSSVDEAVIPVEELYRWAEQDLAPRARLAFDGTGEFNPGEWCRFCLARRNCRALANRQLEIARFGETAPELLSDEEIAEILSRLEGLVSWAKGVQEYALEQAIQGHQYPGFTLAKGKSTRRFKDEQAVAARLEAAGKDPWEPRQMKSLTAIEKSLGKKKFTELLSDLVVRTAGKTVLAPVPEARNPQVSTNAAYAEMMNNERK